MPRPEGYRFAKVTLHLAISEGFDRQAAARCVQGLALATQALNEAGHHGPKTSPVALQRFGLLEGTCHAAFHAAQGALAAATAGLATLPDDILTGQPIQLSEGGLWICATVEPADEIPESVRADHYATGKPTTTHVNEAGNA